MLSGTQKLQAIYDSEQNATITWFWDGGIHAILGDRTNGIQGNVIFRDIASAIDWLYEEHGKHLTPIDQASEFSR